MSLVPCRSVLPLNVRKKERKKEREREREREREKEREREREREREKERYRRGEEMKISFSDKLALSVDISHRMKLPPPLQAAKSPLEGSPLIALIFLNSPSPTSFSSNC